MYTEYHTIFDKPWSTHRTELFLYAKTSGILVVLLTCLNYQMSYKIVAVLSKNKFSERKINPISPILSLSHDDNPSCKQAPRFDCRRFLSFAISKVEDATFLLSHQCGGQQGGVGGSQSKPRQPFSSDISLLSRRA